MATEASLNVTNKATLGNKGLVISVDGDIEGHLMIGKASLVWFNKNAKKQGYKVSWQDFEQWITQRNQTQATRPQVK